MKSFTCTAKLPPSAPQIREVCNKGTLSSKSLKQARHQGVYCWGIAVAQDDNPCLCPRDFSKEKLLNDEAVLESFNTLLGRRARGSSLQEMLDAPAGDVYYVDGAGLGGTIKRALGVTGLPLGTKLLTESGLHVLTCSSSFMAAQFPKLCDGRLRIVACGDFASGSLGKS